MPRLLFLMLADDAPSSRIRVEYMLPVLARHGFESEAVVMPKGFFARARLFLKARNYDVVVLQKKMLRGLQLKLLRRFARRFVFDLDDAIYHRDAACSEEPADYVHASRMKRFTRVARTVDLVIAANNELAGVVRNVRQGLADAVAVVPSAVETEGVPEKNDYTLCSPPRLGWVGSAGTQKYLEAALPALQQIREKTEFELCVVSNRKPDLPGIDVRYVPWTVDGQYAEIEKFDVGIMPLTNDPFSAGKSAYKLLQYMCVGVPSVASAVGMNVDVSGAGEFCLCAEDHDGFAASVLRCLQDQSLREQMGAAGRVHVRANYGIDAVGDLLAESITRMLG